MIILRQKGFNLQGTNYISDLTRESTIKGLDKVNSILDTAGENPYLAEPTKKWRDRIKSYTNSIKKLTKAKNGNTKTGGKS